MSVVGGSMITTEGLTALVESGTSIVPKYFKFSSQTTELSAALTSADITGWIQKDISLYQQIDDQTIEFVCDVLPGEAIDFTGLCGLYLEDGTLFMVAKPPNSFPSNLRQTFRIQLVYENAASIVDFQYLDLSNTDIRFVETEGTIQALDDSTALRMDNIIADQVIVNTVIDSRVDALEGEDNTTGTRIDTFESLYIAEQSVQDTAITVIQNNRTQDLINLGSAQITQDDRLTVNEIDIDAIEAKSILDRTELEASIAEIILNSDVGTLGNDILNNTNLINSNHSDAMDAIAANASADALQTTDLTALITAAGTASNAEDTTLGIRIDTLDTDTTNTLSTITSDITSIDALIISNKADTDGSIQANTEAIALLGASDVEAVQTELTLLTDTVTTNNTSIVAALNSADTASIARDGIQDSAIDLNTVLRLTTYPTEQTAQDNAISINLASQVAEDAAINLRIDGLGIPDSAEFDDLVVQVGWNTDDLITLNEHFTKISLFGEVTGTMLLDEATGEPIVDPSTGNFQIITNIVAETIPIDGTVGQLLVNAASGTASWQDAPVVYEHPAYSGNDIALNPTALTGANIFDDINIAVTTDTLGHVVSASANATTRVITLNDLGFTGDNNANYIDPATLESNQNVYDNSTGTITFTLSSDGIYVFEVNQDDTGTDTELNTITFSHRNANDSTGSVYMLGTDYYRLDSAAGSDLVTLTSSFATEFIHKIIRLGNN